MVTALPAEPENIVLSCRDVSFAYLDRYPALVDVSLRISVGESVALLGANGSGKSSLLKVLAGLVFTTSGTVSALGQPLSEDALADPKANAALRSRLGFVFQRAEAQLFSASVRAELLFGCRQLGLSKADSERRLEDVASMLGLDEVLDRSPVHLSGGQQKRVAIGSVLVMNPQVLLFDEPTAALDPRTTAWLVQLLDQLHNAGRTVVLATNDLKLAARAERCLVLGEDHRIVADGPSGQILADRDLLERTNLASSWEPAEP